MTIGKKGLGNEYLTPDLCFTAWALSDSIARASRKLKGTGVINPRSKEAPSRMGIWFAATKSPLYTEYMNKRNSGEVKSEGPTIEEHEKYTAIFNKLVLEYHVKFG